MLLVESLNFNLLSVAQLCDLGVGVLDRGGPQPTSEFELRAPNSGW